ncbi:UNVERIFIED_CONTAM: hypothetical protein NCL1_27064 [Trichonephila clavipes]
MYGMEFPKSFVPLEDGVSEEIDVPLELVSVKEGVTGGVERFRQFLLQQKRESSMGGLLCGSKKRTSYSPDIQYKILLKSQSTGRVSN